MGQLCQHGMLGSTQGLQLLMKSATARGISLIELVIGMAILALIATQAVPSFNAFMINQRIRAAAEAMASMLQLGRAEAIQRNQDVQFVTFNEPIGNSITLVAGGSNWALRTKNSNGDYFAITSRSVAESSPQAGNAAVTSVPTITQSSTVPSVTFNSLGAVSSGAASFDFIRNNPNNIAAYQCASTGPIRCLRVTVNSTGQVRICDPAVTDNTDTRKC